MMRRYSLRAVPVRVLRVAFLLVFLAGWADPVAAQGVRADFDGDGRGDLAVGVPGEKGSSGGVNVIYGSNAGLTSIGNQFFSQAGDVLDTPEMNDNCGAAVAAGEFNGDGFGDLAMGCPGEDVGTSPDMGAVNILYGSVNGLTVTGNQFFGFAELSVGDISNADKCATALAVGDFNGDGLDDLAMGCPGREFGVTVEGAGVNNAGRVVILFGSASGLTTAARQNITQATLNVPDSPESEDACGSALAAGDFNGDAFADLAVGCPGEDVAGNSDLGGANVLPGAPGGLTGTGSTFWSFSDLAPDDISFQDRCASALAAGDFDGNDFDDLAIGCPGREAGVTVEGGGGVSNAGRVIVLDGSATGITATGRVSFTQNTTGIPDAAEANDNCGASVAAGDFNGDGLSDLAVGCPNEDVPDHTDFGGVNTIYGTVGGLTAASSQFFAFNDFLSFADRCATGLSAGDFNGNGIDDLAIGCPGFDLNVFVDGGSGPFDAGRVIVLHGSAANRLSTTGRQSFTQDTTGIAGSAQEGDAFGFALAGMGGFAAPGLTGRWQEVVHTCDGNGNSARCRLTGTFEVINPSTQSVPPTVLRFYLSPDSTLDPTDLLLREVGVGALKNGEMQKRRLNVRLPFDVDASGQFVIAFTDAEDVVDETNEANNIVVFGPLH
jgi:hypothetical protein